MMNSTQPDVAFSVLSFKVIFSGEINREALIAGGAAPEMEVAQKLDAWARTIRWWGWDFPRKLMEVKRVCLKMVSTPLYPMVLLIIIPIKWLFHWEYTLFSDKPKRQTLLSAINIYWTRSILLFE